jgi:hypothetical protein
VMSRGIITPFIDAQHNRDVFVLGGSRNDNFLDRAAQVLLGVLGFCEPAGRFDHNLNAEFGPIDLGRVLDRVNVDALSID